MGYWEWERERRNSFCNLQSSRYDFVYITSMKGMVDLFPLDPLRWNSILKWHSNHRYNWNCSIQVQRLYFHSPATITTCCCCCWKNKIKQTHTNTNSNAIVEKWIVALSTINTRNITLITCDLWNNNVFYSLFIAYWLLFLLLRFIVYNCHSNYIKY